MKTTLVTHNFDCDTIAKSVLQPRSAFKFDVCLTAIPSTNHLQSHVRKKCKGLHA